MKISKVILLFLLLASVSSAFSSKAQVRITNGEWPPYLSKSLPEYGFASHLVKEAFLAADIDVVYGFYPWKRAYQYVKHGQDSHGQTWNGSIVWSYTAERAKEVLFSDVVIVEKRRLYHLKSNPIIWGSLNDLKGLTIGATLHTSYPLFESLEAKGILKIERAGNYEQLLKRLLAGRIDAVPLPENVANFFIKNSLGPHDRAKIEASSDIIDERRYHLILSKKDTRNKKYLDAFNLGLKRLKASGKYDAILMQFHQGNDP